MKIDLNKLPIKYWNGKTKISYIQRHILVHSILYYELNKTIISDKDYDELSYQLVELMKAYPDEKTESQYWYCMYDFDGSTGFDLYNRLNKSDKRYLKNLAIWVLETKQNINKT